MSLSEILEAAETLTLDKQLLIEEVLHKRIVEKHRQQLFTDIAEARQEYQSGSLLPQTVKEILSDIQQ